jgi:hypothetical protein
MGFAHTAVGGAIALAISIAACHSEVAAPDGSDHSALLAPTVAASSNGLNASFAVWKQGFEHGTTGWIGNERAGSAGWCGRIAHVDRRDLDRGAIMPSAGRAMPSRSMASAMGA